ncbi:hypothetical protein [Kitasatospora cineracea]
MVGKLPHSGTAGQYAARATTPDRWLHGMNRLQRQIETLPAAPEAR